MPGEQSDKVKRALKYQEIIRKGEIAKMAWEAREAELMDQRTRIQEAKTEEKRENARNLLLLDVPIETIAKALGLSEDEIKKLQMKGKE